MQAKEWVIKNYGEAWLKIPFAWSPDDVIEAMEEYAELKAEELYPPEDIQSFNVWANANGYYYGDLNEVWYNDDTEDEVYTIEELLTKWKEETK